MSEERAEFARALWRWLVCKLTHTHTRLGNDWWCRKCRVLR